MSGSLGLDYSEAKNSSQATSSQYGYSSAQSGDVSRSVSEGISGGSSQSQQSVFLADLYKQLYGGATAAAGNVAMEAPALKTAAQQLFTGGSQFLQTLGDNAGLDYQKQRLSSDSAVEDIIASMKTDAGNLFSEKLNPAITADAVAGGNLGGGRQGLAQGVAQAQVANDFTKNAAALRYGDVQAKDAIAASIAGNSIVAANTGLGALPSLLDTLERGQNAELAPYSSLSSILGGPTTLNESSANDFSRSTSQSAADAFSRSFGEQSAQSQSTSRGRSNAYGYQGSYSQGPSFGS